MPEFGHSQSYKGPAKSQKNRAVPGGEILT
jgi:hypothetical protein